MRGEKSRRSQKRTTLRATQLFQIRNWQKFLQNFFSKKNSNDGPCLWAGAGNT